jgi:Reverse transcriptase (RNA-dependent DNA polymerase)
MSSGWMTVRRGLERKVVLTVHTCATSNSRGLPVCRPESLCGFVDFEKAFDSLPRKALYECLDWIGIPSDLLSMIMAIHECPRRKVCGSAVWFKVTRGVQQGCVLGPTMFIILLAWQGSKA